MKTLKKLSFEIKERFRRNKMVMRRYVEISRYIAKIELCLPDNWVFPEYDEVRFLESEKPLRSAFLH